MEVQQTPLAGLLLIQPRRFGDDRGFFQECYHRQRYQEAGLAEDFVQDNFSVSARGVLRGLHYQLPFPQGKLVWVIRGEIFDVAVDLRRQSPTFGRWWGHRLSDSNGLQMYVPPGFAHGFGVLSERAEVFYKCTSLYQQATEHVLRWDDPEVGIDWPIANPQISPRDAAGRSLSQVPHFD